MANLLLFELDETPGVPLDDVGEVSNDVAALHYGLKRLKEGFPLSKRALREMHVELLSCGRGSSNSPGESRRTQNRIGGTRPGNAQFVPPPPGAVEDCMAALERFLQEKPSPYSALIKAALTQFETIHPFLDGKGRLVRFLIAFVWHAEGVLSQPLLHLSLLFKQHRSEYYRLLDLVCSEGEGEAWVDFFLEGVEQTASRAVQTAKRLVTIFREDEQRLAKLGRLAANTLRVHRMFCERPFLTLPQICSRADITFPTAAKGVENLIELGVVRELTGQRRHRIFAYDRHPAILNEETGPL